MSPTNTQTLSEFYYNFRARCVDVAEMLGVELKVKFGYTNTMKYMHMNLFRLFKDSTKSKRPESVMDTNNKRI